MLSENQEYLKILADLIKIKSVNDHELEVAEYLKDLFQKNDIHSEILPIKGQRVNLVAEIGSGAPVLAVSGHMDVVDPGNLAAWDSDPFTMTEKDGKLFGRGITDMKAGLAALVIAMIELKKQGLLKKVPSACLQLPEKKLVKKVPQPFTVTTIWKTRTVC